MNTRRGFAIRETTVMIVIEIVIEITVMVSSVRQAAAKAKYAQGK